MKFISLPAFAVLLICTAVACGPLIQSKHSNTSNIDLSNSRIQQKFPGYTMEEYKAGESLYTSNCGRCHSLYDANAFVEEKWGSIVPKMAKKVNHKVGANVINQEGESLLLKYLYAQGMAHDETGHEH